MQSLGVLRGGCSLGEKSGEVSISGTRAGRLQSLGIGRGGYNIWQYGGEVANSKSRVGREVTIAGSRAGRRDFLLLERKDKLHKYIIYLRK